MAWARGWSISGYAQGNRHRRYLTRLRGVAGKGLSIGEALSCIIAGSLRRVL